VKPHGDLEELARAATPGKWQVEHDKNDQANIYGPDDHWVALLPHQCVVALEQQMNRDAAYVAAANPARVLSLIGEVRELRADNEMWRRVATSAWNLLDTVEPNDPATAELWEALQGFRRVLEETK
jgi:hypothetical protein